MDLIRKHIESIPKVITAVHQSLDAIYLDSQLTIKKVYEAVCTFVNQNLPKAKLDSRVSFEKVYRASSAVSTICHFSCHLNKDQCAICLKKRIRWQQ